MEALDWLLASDHPEVRRLAERDLRGGSTPRVAGPWTEALLNGPDVYPYKKWVGVHWRLVSLAELDADPADPRIRTGVERVLVWMMNPQVRKTPVVDGLPRRHASIDGNALAVASRFGAADDPRTKRIADDLVAAQWPDGGWNCDPNATRRSSFHETLCTMWGLHEYATATGDGEAAAAARRAAELFLEHRLFRTTGGDVIRKQFLDLRYPAYWHYDILQALVILSRMGLAGHPRAADALDEVERQRQPDGRWRARGYWWNPPGSKVSPDLVNWGRNAPNEMVTLNALRVFRATQ